MIKLNTLLAKVDHSRSTEWLVTMLPSYIMVNKK